MTKALFLIERLNREQLERNSNAIHLLTACVVVENKDGRTDMVVVWPGLMSTGLKSI